MCMMQAVRNMAAINQTVLVDFDLFVFIFLFMDCVAFLSSQNICHLVSFGSWTVAST